MLHTSLAGRSSRKCVICSRGMKYSVPATIPVAVIPDRPASSKLLARPKSASLAVVISASASRMFSGLMSRCTKPFSCAKLRPSSASRVMRAAASTSSGPSRFRSTVERLPPGQYSSAKKKVSPSMPWS